jgi:hypothetical protein
MTIKAGDRILNLSAPWSGKIRSMSRWWVMVDLPTHEPVAVRRSKIKYNYNFKSWEVIGE